MSPLLQLLSPRVPSPHRRVPPVALGATGRLATTAAAVIGSPDTVRQGLDRLLELTQADEFMLVSDVFDPALRLRSLDLAAQAMQ